MVRYAIHNGGGLCGAPPLWESFMEAGFAKVDHRKWLGFPKGPGTQGPGTRKYCIGWSLRILGFQDPNGIPNHVDITFLGSSGGFVMGWKV
jgi:hypothetical protein